MKSVPLLFSLLFLCFCFSCDKKDDPTPEEIANQNKVVETWKSDKAPTVQVSPSADSLFVISYKQNGRLEMKVKFKGEGKYSFPEAGSVTYYELVGGDVVTSTYALVPTDKTSELVVSKWNPDTKAVEASFQVTLKKNQSAPGTQQLLQLKGGEVKGTATVKAPTTPESNTRKTVQWVNTKEPVIKMGSLFPGVDSMGLVLHHDKGRLQLLLPFKGIGKYPAHTALTGSYYELDGTDWTAMFGLLYNGVSEVEITAWDPVSKKIKGTFSVSLKKQYINVPSQNSVQSVQSEELVTFTDGTFEGIVKPY